MGKLCKILAICTMSLLLISGCADKATKETPNTNTQETTTLHIIVNNEDEEIFNKKVSVQGKVETLADFLEKADTLKVKMEDSQYGKKIVSILGVETKDWSKGPWWMYESSNNEACQAAGQCDAASSLKIKDGDDFTFNFQGM